MLLVVLPRGEKMLGNFVHDIGQGIGESFAALVMNGCNCWVKPDCRRPLVYAYRGRRWLMLAGEHVSPRQQGAAAHVLVEVGGEVCDEHALLEAVAEGLGGILVKHRPYSLDLAAEGVVQGTMIFTVRC